MGMALESGGNLTHGHQTEKRKVSATSKYYRSSSYRSDPTTGLLDYDEI